MEEVVINLDTNLDYFSNRRWQFSCKFRRLLLHNIFFTKNYRSG